MAELCPICHGPNHCCNNQDNSMGSCWCTEKTFPEGVFLLVPEEEIRRTCICQTCLDNYIRDEEMESHR